jgi:UDP-glucose 4-epimerase
VNASVVVTGSAGSVGRALICSLDGSGQLWRGIDVEDGPFTTHRADLVRDDLRPLLEGGATIVHCASLHAPHVGIVPDSDFYRVNVGGTERLLDAALAVGIKRVVFLSTTSVYGDALVDPVEASWVTEDLVPRPRDIYDITKLQAEQSVEAAHCRAMTTATLRLARCFPESWRTTVVNRLYRGLDIRDAVVGILAAVNNPLPSYYKVNVAGPRVFERTDCAELRADAPSAIRRRLPHLEQAFHDQGWSLPKSIDRVYVSDLSRELLGYTPAHGVHSALAPDPSELPHEPS